jgi:hypothetical protein
MRGIDKQFAEFPPATAQQWNLRTVEPKWMQLSVQPGKPTRRQITRLMQSDPLLTLFMHCSTIICTTG